MPFDSSEELLGEEYEEIGPPSASDTPTGPEEKEKYEQVEAIEVKPLKGSSGRGSFRKRKRKSRKKMSPVWQILMIGLVLITIGTVGYIGYLFYDVDNILQPDVPPNELSYPYPGERKPYPLGDPWKYPPETVVFEREKAYEKHETEYLDLLGLPVVPIRQEEIVYVNGFDQFEKEPPFFGVFHIGSIKTLNEMDLATITYYANARMEEILEFRNIHLVGLIEEKDYEHKIDGQKAYYYEYKAELPKGADDAGYVIGRDVNIALVVWLFDEDMSGKYFIGISVVNIRNEDLEDIEDDTAWVKIRSLIPRISVDN